ncbi:MAG: J domain-containing protein [Deltaproteobacteria bacterium]|nr:J domain-containing protein [Deltaproteobacteria bacterium]
MENRDYYEILGIDKSADIHRIKDCYRKLALKYHPDRNNGSKEAAEKMKTINEAYAVLSNPRKRQEYDAMKDRYGSSAYSHFRHNYSEQDIFSGSDINRIFEELSRSFGLRGFDEIFKEAYRNGTYTFQFKGDGTAGRGYIFTRVSGERERQKRQGQPFLFPNRGIGGRLLQYAFKKVSGLAFRKRGKDIVDIIRLTPETARTGGPHIYTHWRRDKKIIVKIPTGVRSGQKIRIAGQGEEAGTGAGPGDLYLKVLIKRPLLSRIAGIANILKK